MQLHGNIGLIKYVRRLTGLGLVESKNIVDAFASYHSGHACETAWSEIAIIRLSLFVGKIQSKDWALKDGKVIKQSPVTHQDVEALTEF